MHNAQVRTPIAVDRDGYLKDLSQWSEAVAAHLAQAEGLTLTAEHWRLLHIVREFHARTGVSPAMRALVKLAGETMGAHWGNSLALLRLFPGNPAKLAAKIAGLPRPTHCI
jgi:tRNA 2-thiouridine synthesizing protein E